MTRDEALTLLRSVTYKPEYELRVLDEPNHIGIEVTFWPTDATKGAPPRKRTRQTIIRCWTPTIIEHWPQGHLLSDLRQVFLSLETHELDEWLRHDGHHVRTPHPEQDPS